MKEIITSTDNENKIGKPITMMKKKMTAYFSFGVESRIAFGKLNPRIYILNCKKNSISLK